MSKHTLHMCPLCNAPIEVTGLYGSVEKKYTDKAGVCIEIGYSEGGWGWRRDWLPKFSEEVCRACFDELGRLLEPTVAFIRGGARRQEHHVHPMSDDKPPSGGRAAQILRALPPFRRRSASA